MARHLTQRGPSRARRDILAAASTAAQMRADVRNREIGPKLGDEQLDSAHLAAAGARVDSLQVTLRLFVGGVEKHREEWGSSYELAFLDSARFQPAQFDSLLRAKLDTVLASIVVQRLDAPSVRLMAEDSAILAGLDPRPTHRISFSYGFETTVRLVWDAPRQQFVRLWSCC